jgi:RNA polymerase sigma-70 factor, ECF subfamily
MIDLKQAESLSDEEIAKLVLENQEYFLVIIERYKVKLFTFIRRITNASIEDAEDILQDIFLKIYLNLNDFDGDLKFSSWAYAITRNQVISRHRKLQVRAEGHKADIEEESAEKFISNFDIERDIDSGILKERVGKVLDNLNDKYKEVLILKFLEEKNYKEISDIIKCPIGTVGSTMNRAKEIFKKEWEKQSVKSTN